MTSACVMMWPFVFGEQLPPPPARCSPHYTTCLLICPVRRRPRADSCSSRCARLFSSYTLDRKISAIGRSWADMSHAACWCRRVFAFCFPGNSLCTRLEGPVAHIRTNGHLRGLSRCAFVGISEPGVIWSPHDVKEQDFFS